MKQRFWVLVCLLSAAVFVVLAAYGWSRRFGGGEIAQPEPQAVLRVPYIASPVELGADKGPDHAVWKDVPTAAVPLMHLVAPGWDIGWTHLPESDWVGFVGAMAVTGVIYVGLLFGLRVLRTEDVGMIRELRKGG